MRIYSSKRVNTKTNTLNGRDRILGAFYTGAVFSSFMTNYSESYIEDLTVDSTLKHFVNSKKDFKGLMSKKNQNHVNLLVSQNAGFKLFNAYSSRYKKQVKNSRL